MRAASFVTALFVLTACPPSTGTTTADPTGADDTSATTDDPGTTSEPTTGEPTTGSTTDSTDSTTSGAELLETCADVKADQPGAADGEYTLHVGKDPNKAWTAYCKDMGGEPLEYLPLVNVQDGRNFSQYKAGGGSPGTDVRTSFTHLRIDPISLLVDIDDLSFSTSTGQLMHGQGAVTAMPYAVAESCGADAGVANVDLVGTPFKLKESFCTSGFMPVGDTVLAMHDQVADLTGGGGCGWSSPSNGDACTDNPQNHSSGFVLDLEYMLVDAYDLSCEHSCDSAVGCKIFPDMPTCLADCLPGKSGGAKCDAALAVTNECLALQDCQALAKSLYEQMYGDCSDEIAAEDIACM